MARGKGRRLSCGERTAANHVLLTYRPTTGARVQNVDAEGVVLSTGRIVAKTVIWAEKPTYALTGTEATLINVVGDGGICIVELKGKGKVDVAKFDS